MVMSKDPLPFSNKEALISTTWVLIKLLEQFQKKNIVSTENAKIEPKIKTSLAHLSIVFNTLWQINKTIYFTGYI